MRLSNFLLWQASYSEFYATNTLWPDFDEKEYMKKEEYMMHKKEYEKEEKETMKQERRKKSSNGWQLEEDKAF